MKGSISGGVTEKYLPAPREREAEYRAFRHQKYSFSHRKTKSLFTEMSRRGARSPQAPSSGAPLPLCRRDREGGQSRHINRIFSPHSQAINHSAQAPPSSSLPHQTGRRIIRTQPTQLQLRSIYNCTLERHDARRSAAGELLTDKHKRDAPWISAREIQGASLGYIGGKKLTSS